MFLLGHLARFIQQQDGNTVADGERSTTLVAHEFRLSGAKRQRLLARRTDQNVEEFFRDHGKSISPNQPL